MMKLTVTHAFYLVKGVVEIADTSVILERVFYFCNNNVEVSNIYNTYLYSTQLVQGHQQDLLVQKCINNLSVIDIS
jgi:hypothetical protein